MKIAPSILACDFAKLKTEIDSVVHMSDYLHIDVMDGHFVPNISIGVPVVKSLRPYYDIIFDVHLMITNPLKYIIPFRNSGADIITFHLECWEDPLEVIKAIRATGAKVGISIKPKTNVEDLSPFLSLVDLVLIMSVEPGFGGQQFDPLAVFKVKWLVQNRKDSSFLIQIDGGINEMTAPICKEAGVDIVVAGSYIFDSADRKKSIESLK